MDMFVIQGGTPLQGSVQVSGSKNAALPIMAACLLPDGVTTLQDVPDLVDVSTLSALLRTLGLRIERIADNQLQLKVCDETNCVADYELVRRMRASFCVLGPMLAKRGYACVSLPGGCNIGDRPIDLHIKGLQALGADIRIEKGYVIAEAERLRGANLFLGGAFGSSVTGTCNVMMAAVLAEGVTVIESAACEPEIVDLGNFLNAMGACISGLGTPVIRIEGVQQLNACDYTIVPDRIEAATFMMAASITRGDVIIHNVPVNQLHAVIEKLQQIGVSIERRDDQSIRVRLHPETRLNHTDCCALPYPGIPTDVQAQLMALLSCADGMSVVTDKVFPDRFMHAAELVRMGARIRREGASAIIQGVRQLSGACVMACDLRASAALVLGALAAQGESVVRRIYHLDRGYERLERKLQRLGAQIQRVKDEPKNMPVSLQIASPSESSDRPVLKGPSWSRGNRADSENIKPVGEN